MYFFVGEIIQTKQTEYKRSALVKILSGKVFFKKWKRWEAVKVGLRWRVIKGEKTSLAAAGGAHNSTIHRYNSSSCFSSSLAHSSHQHFITSGVLLITTQMGDLGCTLHVISLLICPSAQIPTTTPLLYFFLVFLRYTSPCYTGK